MYCKQINEGFNEKEKLNFEYKTFGWKHQQNDWRVTLREFDQLGAVVASFEMTPKSKFANYVYNAETAFTNLLLGFPSINVPAESDSIFWLLNGRYFGSENLMHGEFKIESFRAVPAFSTDGGPLMISHKNGKDVIIVSPVTLRSFQKFASSDKWVDEYSSPLEQSMRIKNKIDYNQTTIEYGFGEAFRDTSAYKEANDFDELKVIRSETLFVTSDKGPNAAIEKYGQIMKMFQRLSDTDCPCKTICNMDRQKYIDNELILDKLGYSLENNTHHYFNTGDFKSYDEVVEHIMNELVINPKFIQAG